MRCARLNRRKGDSRLGLLELELQATILRPTLLEAKRALSSLDEGFRSLSSLPDESSKVPRMFLVAITKDSEVRLSMGQTRFLIRDAEQGNVYPRWFQGAYESAMDGVPRKSRRELAELAEDGGLLDRIVSVRNPVAHSLTPVDLQSLQDDVFKALGIVASGRRGEAT
ncbi:MAG: hypothetical protein ACE5KV_01105 [Thermoplasmata archaeon]